MTTQTTSTATAPDGTEFTKISRTGKHFPFAVIARTTTGWDIFTFHSKREQAESKARSLQAWWTRENRLDQYDDFTVVETTSSDC